MFRTILIVSVFLILTVGCKSDQNKAPESKSNLEAEADTTTSQDNEDSEIN